MASLLRFCTRPHQKQTKPRATTAPSIPGELRNPPLMTNICIPFSQPLAAVHSTAIKEEKADVGLSLPVLANGYIQARSREEKVAKEQRRGRLLDKPPLPSLDCWSPALSHVLAVGRVNEEENEERHQAKGQEELRDHVTGRIPSGGQALPPAEKRLYQHCRHGRREVPRRGHRLRGRACRRRSSWHPRAVSSTCGPGHAPVRTSRVPLPSRRLRLTASCRADRRPPPTRATTA
eukprot:scaffold421_cov382-Prasinococcus_capsulatus_cf.AAC.9